MSHHLLVVEKYIAIRHPLAEYLRGCGYKVAEAVTADEAVTLLESEDFKADAVLVDVNALGSMDGFELSKWIRKTQGEIEVFLAGSVEKIVSKAGDLCQESPSLKKPYHHATVLDEIRRRLAARDRGSNNNDKPSH